MEIMRNEDAVRLGFPKRVTSGNAAEVAEEAGRAAAGAGTVVIDLGDTEYLSSAGLRVILGLKKKGYAVRVENASLDVYEVLETTGFTEILPVSKRRRKISLEGAVQIGEGFTSRVYQLDGDTIVKVFIRDPSLEDIQRELNLAKRAFIQGVPTAISYDVVDVDGKLGVVFELLGVGSLKTALKTEPEHREALIGKYIQMMKTINSTDVGDMELPHRDGLVRKELECLRDVLLPEEYDRMAGLLDTVPKANTFVHGDCHVKNVMISGGELLMIDMDTLSAGNPLYELAAVYCTYELFERVWPGNNEEFLGLERGICRNIVERLLDEYFVGVDAAAKRRNGLRVALTAGLHIAAWMKVNVPEDRVSLDSALEVFREHLGDVEDLKLEGIH